MTRKRWSYLALPLVLAALAAGGLWLNDALGEPKPAEQGCEWDPETGHPLPGSNQFCGAIAPCKDCTPTPTIMPGLGLDPNAPGCDWDIETGLPLPGSNQSCGAIAPCANCTLAPLPPTPTIDVGPFRGDPDDALTSRPVHKTGDAAATGRSDCASEWLALTSETTGFSFCFPPTAILWSPARDPVLTGPFWDEQASASLPDGSYVGIHRLARTGAHPALELTDYSSAEFDGKSATRYETRRPDGQPVDPSILLREEFGYLLSRPDGLWQVRVVIQSDGPNSLSEAELEARRALVNQILETIRVP